ncbi:hypothetical protein ON010_g1801 [Phytophthora cinnamomi]|nr:hypothetical protein ON010_g1801 [Phytophthora cinnamomi]
MAPTTPSTRSAKVRCSPSKLTSKWQRADSRDPAVQFSGGGSRPIGCSLFVATRDRSPTLMGQGRKEIFPSVPALVTFMKDARRDEKVLSPLAPIDFMWLQEPQYCARYMDEYKNPEQSLARMCQPRFWAGKGRKDPARIAKITKHTGRMIAVLTFRGDGYKLPILFIIRGKLGGDIDGDELSHYPPPPGATTPSKKMRGWTQ